MKVYLEPTDIYLMEQSAGCLRDRLLIRLLFRLGCRISEALAIKVGDIDFTVRTVTILHLKKRVRLSCPGCKVRFGRRHQFCPECGIEVTEVMKRSLEHRCVRVLPVDKETLALVEDYISRNKLLNGEGAAPIFRLNRHRAWQIVKDCAGAVRREGGPFKWQDIAGISSSSGCSFCSIVPKGMPIISLIPRN